MNYSIDRDRMETETACAEVDRNPTVGENIDFKIVQLQKEITRLEASKATMGPLLGMRIRDIRDAMQY